MMAGLRSVEWPGRLEWVHATPRVLLDGAHNPAGALALREALEKAFDFEHLILLIGILRDKDIKSILHTLAPLAHHIIFSQPQIDRAAPAASLMKALGRDEKKAEVVEDLRQAIQKGLSMTGEKDLLCITGSLYVVGEAKAYFNHQAKS